MKICLSRHFYLPVLCALVSGFPLAAVRAASATIEAKLAPSEGEIMLEGVVLNRDPANAYVVLNVTAFTLPSGKSAALKLPRPKTILISPETQIGVASEAPQNLQALKVGMVIKVIGADGGSGLPLKALRIWWHSNEKPEKVKAPVKETVKVVPEQPVKPTVPLVSKPKVPFNPNSTALPAAQVVDGFRILPVKAGFDYQRHLCKSYELWNQTPSFYFLCRVSPIDSQKTPKTFKSEEMIKVRRIVGPQGQLLKNTDVIPYDPDEPTRKALEAQKNASDIKNSAVILDSNIDPEWDYVFVDMDISEPHIDNQQDQNGFCRTPFEAKAFQIPAGGVGEVPLTQEITTRIGSKIKLEKMQFAADPDAKGAFMGTLFVRYMPAEPVTDQRLILSDYESKSDYYNSENKYVPLFAGQVQSEYTIPFARYIPEVAFTHPMDLKVTFIEQSESRAEPPHRVRFKLPVAALFKANPVAVDKRFTFPVLGEERTPELEIQLENDGIHPEQPPNLVLWQKPTPDGDSNAQWEVRNSSAIQQGSSKKNYVFPSGPLGRKFSFHGDGTLRKAHEEGIGLSAQFEQKDPKVPYSVTLNLEKINRLETWESWEDLPLPPNGDILEMTEPQEENAFRVRKIKRVRSSGDMPSFSTGGMEIKSGLAVVIEYVPLLKESFVRPDFMDAEDEQGLVLRNSDPYTSNMLLMGDVLSKEPHPERFYTIFLTEPSLNSKTFRLWLHATETTPSEEKKTVTVTFENLPRN